MTTPTLSDWKRSHGMPVPPTQGHLFADGSDLEIHLTGQTISPLVIKYNAMQAGKEAAAKMEEAQPALF